MKREDFVVYFSAILILVFAIEVIAPMLLSKQSSNNDIQYNAKDIVQAYYNGPLKLLSISENVLITNADEVLKENISNWKNRFSILYIGEDQNGLSIITRDSKNALNLANSIADNYDVYLIAFFEISNGTVFTLSQTNEKIKLNSTTTFRLVVNRDFLSDDVEYYVEGYMLRNTGEFLSLVSNPYPIEKTEIQQVELVVSKPLMAIFDYNNIKEYIDDLNISLLNATNTMLNYSIQSNKLNIYLDSTNVSKFISSYMSSNSLAADILTQVNYSNGQYLVLLKDLKEIPDLGSVYTVNATIVHIGKKVLKINT